VLESHGHASPLLKKADFRRAGFIEHALWVTAFDADERFASGDTPNQNPDEPGLPRYVADNESIVNRDIVLWHTVTFHHVTAAEDYPVPSREHGSFELKPTTSSTATQRSTSAAPPSRCCREGLSRDSIADCTSTARASDPPR